MHSASGECGYRFVTKTLHNGLIYASIIATMPSPIFKAYDIRGLYPEEINEEIAYKIGRSCAVFLGAKTLAIGRDARTSSPSLFESFVRGATDEGCAVFDLGVVSTPMVYYASGVLPVDAAISLTASHNPSQYNGLKINRAFAVPVGSDSGLREIANMVEQDNFAPVDPTKKAIVTNHPIAEEYLNHIASFADFGSAKIKVVMDPANGMGIVELPLFQRFADNIELIVMNGELDLTFPNHEANPLKTETLDDLCKKVKEEHADIGVGYDGDADRVCFVDETGTVVPMDHTTGLLAKMILEKEPGATILYDLRSTDAVREVIEENGGTAHECRVGHAFIKRQMRDEGAVFGGELSGHYYFKENFTAESATLAVLYLLNLLAKNNTPLSVLTKDMQRYVQSGEINSEVSDKNAVIEKLLKKYADGRLSTLDGIKVVYPDWWFNVRGSNTEPLLRLNVEAHSPALLAAKTEELLTLIRA